MSERESDGVEFSERLRRFHVACIELFEKNRAFRRLVVPMMQSGKLDANARKPFDSLRALKETAALVVELCQGLQEKLREYGIKRGWEVNLASGVEPGWHLLVARLARCTLVETELAKAIDDRQWDRRVTCADFSTTSSPAQEGALHRALYVTSSLEMDSERRVLALEREYLDLKLIEDEGDPAANVGDDAPIICLNHELNLVMFGPEGGNENLAPAQMDLVMLCAFATRKGTWLKGENFKSLGALGNASSLCSRLKPRVKALIETCKNGRRLRVSVNIEQPRKLQSGRLIDWKKLILSEPAR